MSAARAIVIRSDTPDAQYRVGPEVYPQLVDLPFDGQGSLIAPQWVVTAGHATFGAALTWVEVGGKRRLVDRVIVHPGYKKPPQSLTTGDAAPAMAFLDKNDDIALLHLEQPVLDVTPVPIY